MSNLTPEQKQQLEEQKKQCIYCKLVSGEMPAKTVFQDSKTQAFLDIYPLVKGHTVYLLKEHYPLAAYMSAEEFNHFTGLIPQLTQAIQTGMVRTGMNIFIPFGGAAGQQFPHVCMHFFPREEGDNFSKYELNKRTASLPQDSINMLANNLPIMMRNHFGRNPASWHQGKGDVPAYLADIYNNASVIYEDEKVLAVIAEKQVAEGHIEIYSKIEQSDITKLSIEDASHLMFVASFATTALFEGLGAHGSNIIVKSGTSDDNTKEPRLSVHAIARRQDDGLSDLNWQPQQPSYDLDAVKSQIKEETWKVKYKQEKKETLPSVKTESKVMKITEDEASKTTSTAQENPKNKQEEIHDAIKEFH